MSDLNRDGAPALSNYYQFGADGSIRDGSDWKQIMNVSVRNGGSWQQVVKSWVRDGNQWKLWFDPKWHLDCYNEDGQSGQTGTREFTLPNRSGVIYCSVWGAGASTYGLADKWSSGSGGYARLIAQVNNSVSIKPNDKLHLVVGQRGQNSGPGGNGENSGQWTFGGGGSHTRGNAGGGCSGIFGSSSSLTPGSKSWPLYGICLQYGFPQTGGNASPLTMANSVLVVAGGGGAVDRWGEQSNDSLGIGGDGGGDFGQDGYSGADDGCRGRGGGPLAGGARACTSALAGRCWNGGSQKRENSNWWASRLGGGGWFGGASSERAGGAGSGVRRVNGGGWSGIDQSWTASNSTGIYFDSSIGHPNGSQTNPSAGGPGTHGFIHIRNYGDGFV